MNEELIIRGGWVEPWIWSHLRRVSENRGVWVEFQILFQLRGVSKTGCDSWCFRFGSDDGYNKESWSLGTWATTQGISLIRWFRGFQMFVIRELCLVVNAQRVCQVSGVRSSWNKSRLHLSSVRREVG